MRNVYKIVIGNENGRDQMGDGGLEERLISQCNVKK
jgi:hypothetical protein